MILAVLAPALPFIFGRIVEIKVFVRVSTTNLASKFNILISEQPQRKAYSEVLIAGDLSEEDVSRAKAGTSYTTTDPYTAEFIYGNDTIYFAQPSPSQFVSGGSGPGTFSPLPAMGVKDPINNTLALGDKNTPKNDTGAILR